MNEASEPMKSIDRMLEPTAEDAKTARRIFDIASTAIIEEAADLDEGNVVHAIALEVAAARVIDTVTQRGDAIMRGIMGATCIVLLTLLSWAIAVQIIQLGTPRAP